MTTMQSERTAGLLEGEPEISDLVMDALARTNAAGQDASAMTEQEREELLLTMCRKLKLNPVNSPIQFIRLQGNKFIPYIKKEATDQLAARHNLNREITDGPKVIDLAGTKIVYALCKATLPSGRYETSTATLPLTDPCNVLMKCETKAKRRVTLSILGLGLLDESEIDQIPGAQRVLVARSSVSSVAADDAPPSPAAQADAASAPEGSRAFAAYCDTVANATTATRVVELYAGLVSDLREEGHDPAAWLDDGPDGEGAETRALAVLMPLCRLGKTDAKLLLGDDGAPVAKWLDEARAALPGEEAAAPYALACAARWWIANSAALQQMHRTNSALVYASLARMATQAAPGDAQVTKRAKEALTAAIEAMRRTPPDGPGNGTRTPAGTQPANGNGSGVATATATGAPAAKVTPLDREYALARSPAGWTAHLLDIPSEGEDRGAGHVAGSYWKREAAFRRAGTHAQMLAITVDELARRGIAEPSPWLDGVGERNGATSRRRAA
jgi:hypothetical protein